MEQPSPAARHLPADSLPGSATPSTSKPRRAVTELRRHLPPGDLALLFQPCVGVNDGVVVGAEALLRWCGRDGSAIPGDDVITAATAAGVLPAVTDWVLRTACHAATGWAIDGYVSVNLSAAELALPGLVTVVERALRATELPVNRLVVEIRDGGTNASEATVRAICDLHERGVCVALDDFGSGPASLLHLKSLPISRLKIGRLLAAHVGLSRRDDAITASVLNLATGIGADAVTVGVERVEQHAALARLGCATAQGFLYGHAMAGDPTAGSVAPRQTGLGTGPRHARIDPAVVARVRTLVSTGASLSTIAAALNAESLPHPKDRRWHARSVGDLLADLQSDKDRRRRVEPHPRDLEM